MYQKILKNKNNNILHQDLLLSGFELKNKIYCNHSIRRHTNAFDLWGGLKSKRHFAGTIKAKRLHGCQPPDRSKRAPVVVSNVSNVSYQFIVDKLGRLVFSYVSNVSLLVLLLTLLTLLT